MNNIRYSVITTTVSSLLDKNQSDITFLQQRVDKTLPTQLETLQNKDNYCHLTYPYNSSLFFFIFFNLKVFRSNYNLDQKRSFF